MLEIADYVFGSKSAYSKVLLDEKLQLAEKVKHCTLQCDGELESLKGKYQWDAKRKRHVPDFVKSVQIWTFLWSVFSCIWAEYRKIRTTKISVFGHFHAVPDLLKQEYLTKAVREFNSNMKDVKSDSQEMKNSTKIAKCCCEKLEDGELKVVSAFRPSTKSTSPWVKWHDKNT